MRAQVIVLAGPSGSGKSHLAERLGLPVLRLDDFYKGGSDPTLPMTPDGTRVDWDHPDTWLLTEAVAAVAELCRTGRTRTPVYDIPKNGRVGSHDLDLGDHRYFIAEGIFAPEVVTACREAGYLAEAYCLTQRPMVTFWRRLTRDLREGRKPPNVLVRRGFTLMREQGSVVADAIAKGCKPATPSEVYTTIRRLIAASPARLPWGPDLKQPDRYSCGATALVVARMIRNPEYAVDHLPRFASTVQNLHRTFNKPLSALRRPQLPWPRHLGTAFWTVSRQLSDIEGVTYRTRSAYRRPGPAFDLLLDVARRGHLAGLYVGTRILPRHVTLVVGVAGNHLAVFNPATGHVHRVSREQFVNPTKTVGGWPRPWTVVVPRTHA